MHFKYTDLLFKSYISITANELQCNRHQKSWIAEVSRTVFMQTNQTLARALIMLVLLAMHIVRWEILFFR